MEPATILIVEDETIIAMELESELRSLGYQVTSIVNTGKKAIKNVAEKNPDLVLMDIRINGGMDGIDTANIIRSRFGVPVIFSTAFLDEERIKRAKITMPFGYLMKPIQSKDLRVTIEMALYVAKIDKERKEANQALSRKTQKLGERVKELKCLYGISELVEKKNILPEEIFQGTVDLIQAAWQYPDVMRARLIIGDQEFTTKTFRETVWKLTAPIVVDGEVHGSLEVFYLEEKPEEDDGPFIKEESHLINAISARLGRIIERQQAQEAIRKSEARYRTLTENLPDMIIRFDKKLRHVFVSSNIANMFGGKPEDYIGKTVSDLGYSKERVDLWTEKLQAVFKTGEPQEMELNNDCQKGTCSFNCRLTPETDTKGNLEYVLGIVRDITLNKQVKEAEKMRDQQLIQADKMISLGILVSGVAHEINNPNYAIISNLFPLKKIWEGIIPILNEYYEKQGDFEIASMDYSMVREQIPTIFSNISKSSDRIKNIVHELRQFARHQPENYLEMIQLNNVVQSALTLLQSMIKKSTSRFTINLSEDLPLIKGNYQQLEQVVINLVQNACQALTSVEKEEGIFISTFYDHLGKAVGLKVVDEGYGIPKESLQRVTDPFFTTKRDSGGIGLGLSISSRLIMEHGGSLLFTPGLEKGTIVTVSLPVPYENTTIQ